MSADHEEGRQADEGGNLHTGSPGDADVISIARMLEASVRGPGGRARPEALAALELLKDEDRRHALEPLLDALTPGQAVAGVWLEWLRGGSSPFKGDALKAIDTPGKAQSQKLIKLDARIQTAATRVQRIEAELAEAKKRQADLEDMHKGVLQFAVTAHLAEMLGAVFAMGPAWTLMRAISAHISEAEMEVHLDGVTSPQKRELIRDHVVAQRKDETPTMMAVLDQFGGDPVFLHDVRDAILKVTNRYAERIESEGPPRKRRPATEYRRFARPEDQTEISAALDGLRATRETRHH